MTNTRAAQPAALRGRLRLRRKLLLLVGASAVALAVAEIAVRPFVPHEIVGPSAVRYHPVYGRALIPGYTGIVSLPGVSYRLSVNSRGFRGPEPGESRDGCVVVLGDSFTLGDGVDDGEEFARLLEGEIGRPVLNAGLAGDGQGRWIKFLDHEAPDWNPKCVVLQFCANDFRDNHEDGLYALDADGALVELTVPPESPLRALQAKVETLPLVGYSRLYALVKLVVRAKQNASAHHRAEKATGSASVPVLPPDDDPETSAFDDLTFVLLDGALERCAAHGWPVIGMSVHIEPGSRLDRIREAFESAGYPFVAFASKAARPDLHLVRDGHWNTEGHRFAASVLTPMVREALGESNNRQDTP